VQPLIRCLLVLLFSGSLATASVDTARQARAELGLGVWARVLQIENANPRSHYPATVYATVFEFAGLLWFYTDTDGTQSFSLHRGQLDQEKADFLPLLRDVEPGFTRFEVVSDAGSQPAAARKQLPNGCFIDSVAALQSRLARGERVKGAALLSYYIENAGRLRGHTVLACAMPTGLVVIDSAQGSTPVPVWQGSLASEPLKIARAVAPHGVVRANWVPVPLVALGTDYALAGTPMARSEGATGAAWLNP
jgi:hypothetical protein